MSVVRVALFTEGMPFTYFGDIVEGLNIPWDRRFDDYTSSSSSGDDDDDRENELLNGTAKHITPPVLGLRRTKPSRPLSPSSSVPSPLPSLHRYGRFYTHSDEEVREHFRSYAELRQAKKCVAEMIDLFLYTPSVSSPHACEKFREVRQRLNAKTVERVSDYLLTVRSAIGKDEDWAEDRVQMARAFYSQHENIGYVREAVDFIATIDSTSLRCSRD